MIRVWSDNKAVGVPNRLGPKGSTFAYDPHSQCWFQGAPLGGKRGGPVEIEIPLT